MRSNVPGYETASGARHLRSYEAFRAARTCSVCQAPIAGGRVIVWNERRAVCARCDGQRVNPELARRLERVRSVLAGIAAEDAGRGIVGLAAPLGVECRLAGRGIRELLMRDAFPSVSTVPLRIGHGGEELGQARCWRIPGALAFECGDVRWSRNLPCAVSIGFRPLDVDEVASANDIPLHRVREAILTEVALVPRGAYGSTWHAARNQEGWQRLYAVGRRVLADMVA